MRNLIVGIVFIVGGLQGEIVLVGTQSSTAIVAIGVILVLLGICSFLKTPKSVDRVEESTSGLLNFNPSR